MKLNKFHAKTYKLNRQLQSIVIVVKQTTAWNVQMSEMCSEITTKTLVAQKKCHRRHIMLISQ